MKTLLLDLTNWDILLDAAGNLAVADGPYATAQDVASAIKTFLGEVWFDTSIGVPFFTQILGKTPPIQVFQAYMEAAAETVPGVDANSAKCTIQTFQDRTVTGQVTFTSNGQALSVSIQ